MKYKIKSFNFLLQIILVGIATCNIQAQETIASSGVTASGNSGSVSFTAGQENYNLRT